MKESFLPFEDISPLMHVQRVINALDKIADSLDDVRGIIYDLQEYMQGDDQEEREAE